tara:strand:- start:46 stop:162 length:117 start_codon:yes stop_codon:yes gene_type:complete
MIKMKQLVSNDKEIKLTNLLLLTVLAKIKIKEIVSRKE